MRALIAASIALVLFLIMFVQVGNAAPNYACNPVDNISLNYTADVLPENANPNWTKANGFSALVGGGILTIKEQSDGGSYYRDWSMPQDANITIETNFKLADTGSNYAEIKFSNGNKSASLKVSQSAATLLPGGASYSMDGALQPYTYKIIFTSDPVFIQVFIDGVQRLNSTSTTATGETRIQFGNIDNYQLAGQSLWDYLRYDAAVPFQLNTFPVPNITAPLNNTGATNRTPEIGFYYNDSENATSDIVLYFNNTNVSTLLNVSNNTQTNLTAPALADGLWTYYISAFDGCGWGQSLSHNILIDATPPQNVANLNESSAASNSIAWAWTNPNDADFNHTEVWLNGTFKENITANSTAISGLTASTIYELQVRPVDNLGNIGSWTNDTAQTSAAPPPDNPGNPGNGGGGGGGGGGGPACKPDEVYQNGKCIPKPENKTTAPPLPAGKVTVNVLPSPTVNETPKEEVIPTNITSNLAAASAPTGFLVLQKLKSSYSALAIGGMLFAGLIGYAAYSRKIRLPKARLPKISLPRLEIRQKIQKPALKLELPKLSWPKLEAPKISLPRLEQKPKPRPQVLEKNVIVRPKIIVRPQINYKRLAEELKPTVEQITENGNGKVAPREEIPVSQPQSHAVLMAAPPGSRPLPVNSYMKVVMGAMHEREKEVLQTVILHGGKTTMARIYHETGMPPTTLFRWVDSLEKRGLIQTTKLGKLRKVELTEKFLKGSPVAA